MPKRLVVCCDGTWNRPDQVTRAPAVPGGVAMDVPAPTNVAKLALAMSPRDADGVEQCMYYHPGVGTSRRERLRGGAFGLGLAANVRDAYRFLVSCYEPGDELYLFRFSRGAFTARSIAGFVRNAGILRPETPTASVTPTGCTAAAGRIRSAPRRRCSAAPTPTRRASASSASGTPSVRWASR